MQRLEVSGAVRPIYGSLGVKRLSVRRIAIMDPVLTHMSPVHTHSLMFRDT